ncbi:phosphoribosyltransferase domain-containing protein [Nocardioides sp.]|uniref:phosphoribosyltransferase domain-containing protein n=1 Tax=Nocardioides sp. TaxID=35761 RepID=UPI0035164B6B
MSPTERSDLAGTSDLASVVAGALVVDGAMDPALEALAGLALRDNPRRAHLVVSRVLGKHLPVAPGRMRASAEQLADLVRGCTPDAASTLVLGFCETATGLGHAVARALDADYLSSTRRPVPGREAWLSFEEAHSHATSHHLQPGEHLDVATLRPVVLVDDELTTGATALDVIARLEERGHRDHYVLAALLDARGDDARRVFEARVREMGVEVRVVALVQRPLALVPDALERARALRATLPPAADPPTSAPGLLRSHHDWWPLEVPVDARGGLRPEQTARLLEEADRVAARLARAVVGSGATLVLGAEELMFLPAVIGEHLAERRRDLEVVAQSTTRSPAVAADVDGYAIRRTLSFAAPDDPARIAFLHNVVDPARRPSADGGPEAPARPYVAIVLVVDASLPACSELVAALRPFADAVHVVSVGVRRAFGSYAAEEVTWLLSDLSHEQLELSTEQRERAIQGGVSYAEMLPQEHEPDDAYLELFHRSLERSARRVAVDTAVLAELLLRRHALRGVEPVLVSLARAGTPVGILARRYVRAAHRRHLSHYAMSIIRGRGLDEVALARVLEHHPPAAIAFVDGWTGKGAVQQQLIASRERLVAARGDLADLDPELAVLADPGGCTSLFATREDYLVPSACLNATVSGLVSRTVQRPDLIGPEMYHGAKYYAELAAVDQSAAFLDAVSAHFADGAAAIADEVATRLAEPVVRTPTWAGQAEVRRLAERHGVDDLHRIKPGVGETSRVLLRRAPWKVLVHPDRLDGLDHVLALAASRGVAVEEDDELVYACVGLVRAVRP